MTPDDMMDQQNEEAHRRAEWKHSVGEVGEWQSFMLKQLTEAFEAIHATLLLVTPDNGYRRQAEQQLEMAALLGKKAITHDLPPDRQVGQFYEYPLALENKE